jgi:tripartite-type tricarboxylate transporter receptor subunit TctC
MPRFAAWIFSVGMMASAGTGVLAQNFPNKPIRLVTAEPGGNADFVSRVLAQGLSASLGQQVVVDNRGGSGVIQAETVSNAAPDGYTLLSIASPFWLAPLLQANLRYDPVRDFSPVTLATRSPSVLVVHASLPVNSVRELIALAKTRPGNLNYGSGPSGASSHLAPELFKSMAGIDIVRVAYKGTGPALNALIADQVQLMFASPALAMPHVKSGRLKALAVTSAQSSVLLPELPAIADSGLPGYESVAMVAVFAPARTPDAIIKRLNQESVRFLNSPEAKQRFLNAGAETVGSSPAELTATLKSEMTRIGKVIRNAGIRDE